MTHVPSSDKTIIGICQNFWLNFIKSIKSYFPFFRSCSLKFKSYIIISTLLLTSSLILYYSSFVCNHFQVTFWGPWRERSCPHLDIYFPLCGGAKINVNGENLCLALLPFYCGLTRDTVIWHKKFLLNWDYIEIPNSNKNYSFQRNGIDFTWQDILPVYGHHDNDC